MLERKFLWKPDPPSAKDWPATPILKVAKMVMLPERMRLAQLITSILQQGGLGSCTANAVAQGLRAAMVRLGLSKPDLASRLFLYYFARAMIDSTQVDSGAHIRNLFDVIRKLGFCPEPAWPYSDDLTTFKILPNAGAARLAFDQIGSLGYFRINSTGAERVADVRAAIAAEYTVVFGTQVSNKFAEYTAGSAPLGPPGAGETILGGHALLVGGYDLVTDDFDIVNSWGLEFGVNGWCKFKSSYLADDRSADFWIIETAPNFSEVAT
jgi:C1A family cysteine protease